MTVDGTEVDDQSLRRAADELAVISPHAFVPDARFRNSWACDGDGERRAAGVRGIDATAVRPVGR